MSVVTPCIYRDGAKAADASEQIRTRIPQAIKVSRPALRVSRPADNAPGQRQCGVYTPTKVISASYGQAEADLPANYVKRQCNEFMKLGLQGHSILVSSGDYGVASFPGDGADNGCLGPENTIFNPQYPSGCPYLTSVGATMLYPDQTVLDGESVMHVNLSGTEQNFTSSGGFSNYFAAPDYQEAALAAYFADHDPPYPYYAELEPDFDAVAGLYNRVGRGYVDVSANGANLVAYTNGGLVRALPRSPLSVPGACVLTSNARTV